MQEQTIDLAEQLQLQEALEALSIDAVVSAEHLEHRYQTSLERAEKHGFRIIRRELNPSLGGSRPTIAFVTPYTDVVNHDTRSLCLLAGMAELRYQLGLPTYCWNNRFSTRLGEHISPKAEWHIGSEDVVIDYDTGKCSESYVRTAENYRDDGYLRQIWGAPTQERRDELEAAIQSVDPTAQVIYAPYIPEPEEIEEEEFRRREAARKDRGVTISLSPDFP